MSPNSVDELGDVLVFVARHVQRGLDGAIQVDVGLGARVRVRELGHRAHDGAHAADALERAIERVGCVLEEVVDVRRFVGVGGFLRRVGHVLARQDARGECAVIGERVRHVPQRMAHEAHAVGDELHRGIDLVRHAGRDAADRFELLALRHLTHQAPRLGDVDHESAQQSDVVHDFAGHGPSKFHHAIVGCDHRAQGLETAGGTFVQLSAYARLATTGQQCVEVTGFLPARFRDAEHTFRLRADVGEAAFGEVQLERNGARGLGDEAVLFAAAFELARALFDMFAEGFIGELQRGGMRRRISESSSGSRGPRAAG